MKFATITPTRGDRQELLQFTLSHFPKSKDLHGRFIISERSIPPSERVDIVPRIKKGIELAQIEGIDFVFIIEDDDHYSENYFNSWGDLSNLDFVGFSDTTYYNIKNRTWQAYDHPERSSLFCTGFRISALDRFNWPDDHWPFLDVRLWEYANRYEKRISLLPNNPNIGIKHGIGKCAGKGHQMRMKNEDPNLEYLTTRVDQTSLEFYKGLMNKTQIA